MFHICSGTNPNSDLNNNPLLLNYVLLFYCILYATSIIVCGGKIILFKNKAAGDGNSVSRNVFLKSLEKQSLSDFTSSTWGIIGTCTAALLYVKIHGLTTEQLKIYPNYIFIYLIHLVNGPLTCIVLIALCYYRNKVLRKVIFREAKHLLRMWKNKRRWHYLNIIINA